MVNTSRHLMQYDKQNNIITLKIFNVNDYDAGW